MRARVSNLGGMLCTEHSDPPLQKPPQILMVQTSRQRPGFQLRNLKIWNCRALGTEASLSAAPLAGATFGANAARAGTDHLVAAAY
jgi:hypothetical protein